MKEYLETLFSCDMSSSAKGFTVIYGAEIVLSTANTGSMPMK